MFFQFSGSGRVQSAGVGSVISLLVVSVVAPGSSLTLRWNGQNHVLKFVTTPSLPGEFSAGDGSNAYKADLCQELKAWWPLREDYHISLNPFVNAIELTAKRPGPAFDMPLLLPLGTPFSVGTLTKGADPVLRLQYSVYTEVWAQRPGTPGTNVLTDFVRIFSSPIECDAEGLATFDAGSLLHSQLSADWPVWSMSNPQGATNSHRKYFVAYAEAFGSPLQIGTIGTDQIRHAYLGGADFRHRASSGFDLGRFTGAGPTNKALRFGPLTRYIRPDEPQFLTFLNQANEIFYNLNLRLTLTFTDGGTQQRDDLIPTQTLPIGEKIVFPVGVAHLNLSDLVPAGKTLQQYTVQILLNMAPWSEVYRYVLDGRYSPYTRYFAYLSSLGCLETLATYGKGSSELTRFSEQAERHLPAQYDVQDGQFVDYNISLQQQVEVATGFWPQSVLRGWTDFYRSPNRFRLKGGQALPIGIVSKSIKQAKDGDTLFAHQFAYTYLYRDDFYTADENEESGDGPLPVGFVPTGGSVSISQPSVVQAVDNTIPAHVRSLTLEDINKFRIAAARPNPSTLGFLTHASASPLFRRTDQPLSYATDLTDKPTTRDAAGLTDVPTRDEVASLPAGGLRLPASDAVTTADGIVGYQHAPADPANPAGPIISTAKTLEWPAALDALVAALTSDQAVLLLSKLKPTLDQVLAAGAESNREQIIRASHRRTLRIEDELHYLQGRVKVGNLYEERHISPAQLAAQVQPLLDVDALADAVAERLGLSSNVPFEWIFEPLLACEDNWKEYGRDDFDNTDFQ